MRDAQATHESWLNPHPMPYDCDGFPVSRASESAEESTDDDDVQPNTTRASESRESVSFAFVRAWGCTICITRDASPVLATEFCVPCSEDDAFHVLLHVCARLKSNRARDLESGEHGRESAVDFPVAERHVYFEIADARHKHDEIR